MYTFQLGLHLTINKSLYTKILSQSMRVYEQENRKRPAVIVPVVIMFY